MKNIQIIDGAVNATFSIFQATDEEFAAIFPKPGQDLEVVEDFIKRAGEDEASRILTPIWKRPIHKPEVQGLHGTLFYDYKHKARYLPKSRREADRNPQHISEAQRRMYQAHAEKAADDSAASSRVKGPTHT